MEMVHITFSDEIMYQDGYGIISSFPDNSFQVLSSAWEFIKWNVTGEQVFSKIQIGIMPSSISTPSVFTKALFDLESNINSFVELILPEHIDSSLSVRQNAAVVLG